MKATQKIDVEHDELLKKNERVMEQYHRDLSRQMAVQHAIGYREGWKWGLALGVLTGAIAASAVWASRF